VLLALNDVDPSRAGTLEVTASWSKRVEGFTNESITATARPVLAFQAVPTADLQLPVQIKQLDALTALCAIDLNGTVRQQGLAWLALGGRWQVHVSVAAGAVRDLAGLPNRASNVTAVVDLEPPTVLVSFTLHALPTPPGQAVQYVVVLRFTFGEEVSPLLLQLSL
jgi:hypothetical protein